MLKENENITIKVQMGHSPINLDPYNYDLYVHHQAFTSLFSTLVSQYKTGEITPLLAKKWTPNSNFTEWNLEIRDDIYFSDGSLVTPEKIVQSLQRIAFLQKKKSSNSGLLNLLLGFDLIKNPTDTITGLTYTKNNVFFKFNEPVPKFLEKISFGLYGITSPTDWNPSNGKWLDPKKAITSGPYVLNHWNKESIQLEFNHRWPLQLVFTQNPKLIEIEFDVNLDNNPDIVIGANVDTKLQKSTLSYFGLESTNINYLEPFFLRNYSLSKSDRHKLRALFYDVLEKEGFKVTRSFFPLAINGIKEGEKDSSEKINLNQKIKSINAIYHDDSFIERAPIAKGINSFYSKLEKDFGLKLNKKSYTDMQWHLNPTSGEQAKIVDFIFKGTGILTANPYEDIKFMFLSKEGIQLPDEDQRIINNISSTNKFNVQEINEIIWDQALIWPLYHYGMGMWVSERINLNILNSQIPPTNFLFVGLHKC